MPLPPVTPSAPPAHDSAVRGRTAETPEEAARQFEAVLVRQFVEVLTRDLFKSEAGGMLTGQADLQRDTITDVLTDTLVDSGSFGVADLMTQQWTRAGRMVDPSGTGSAAAPGDAPAEATPGPSEAPWPGRPAPVRPATRSHDTGAPAAQTEDAQEQHLDAVEEALRRYSRFSRVAPSDPAPTLDPPQTP